MFSIHFISISESVLVSLSNSDECIDNITIFGPIGQPQYGGLKSPNILYVIFWIEQSIISDI